MADQQKWFKLWVTAPGDDHIQRLPVEDRWAWAALGAYTKAHGTHGRVEISSSNSFLAAAMGVTPETLIACVKRLPHIDVEMLENRHDETTVTVVATWRNWVKYQEDSSMADRSKRYRASRPKKRGEEKRGDKKIPPQAPQGASRGFGYDLNGDEPETEQSAPGRGAGADAEHLDVVPDELRDANTLLEFLNAKTSRTYGGLANLQLIDARLREGWSVQDCKTMVMRKVNDWRADARMATFLRPATLFNRAKLEGYMGELGFTRS